MESDNAHIIRRFFRAATPHCLKRRLLPFEAALQMQATEFCRRYPDRLVLDVGCGRARYHGNTIGIDLQVANLQKRPGQVVCGNAMQLPFGRNCFDAALCSAALHHFEDPDLALIEMHRVLQDGGELLLTIPDRFPKTEQADDHWRFDRPSITGILERAGWNVAACAPMGGRFWILSRNVLEWLFRWDQGIRLIMFALFAPLLGFLLPVICFYLDKFVQNDGATLGWVVVARKDRNAHSSPTR